MAQMTTRQRRRIIPWYLAHGKHVPATAAQFGVSPATVYRWLAQYAAHPDQPLRAKSRKPHHTRLPAWTPAEVLALCGLLCHHPQWGRGRLTVALRARHGSTHSASSVGRMLQLLRRRCPVCLEHDGRYNPLTHALKQDLASLGLPPTLPGKLRRLLTPDREKAAVLRAAEAFLGEEVDEHEPPTPSAQPPA